jgi:periplasmic protein TonB
MLAFPRNVTVVVAGYYLLLALLFAGPAGQAATRPPGALTGRVHDADNQPLPGVVVTLKGPGTSAITNATGYFVLECAEATPTLVLNCAGYHSQTVQAQGGAPLDIVLYKAGAPMPASLALAAALEAAKSPVAAPDEAPAFPGGVAGYRAYLKQHFRYPEEAQRQNISCEVVVGFAVDEVGRILDAEIIKSCAPSLNEEAMRLVRLMPWWTPARRAGQPVRATTSLHIRFELQ